MSTSNTPIPDAPITRTSRRPLRLRMAEDPGKNQLDGGWWPQSRDLTVELADLVDHFPAEYGRIARALVSPPDWEPAPRRIPVARGYVKAGSFPHDDTHLIDLKILDRATLRLVVIPPGFTADQGAEALLAAATAGNAHSAGELLREVTDQPDTDSRDQWSDKGGSWWGSDVGAPSFRARG